MNKAATANDPSLILLGTITRAQGIRGEVVVRTYTGVAEDIAAYGPLTDARGQAPLSLSVVRVSDKGVVVRIDGVNDRNGAEALRGRDLYVARDRLPQAEDGEYYHADLIGLEVVLEDGAGYGRIVSVQNFGAGDLLEISRPDERETVLLPFSDACVPSVDVGAGRVVVILPDVIEGDEDA